MKIFIEVEKKSFLVYSDLISAIQEMSDIETGKLFRAMLQYHNGIDVEIAKELKPIWGMLKAQFDRDLVKYTEKCKKNAENIKKRWNKKVNCEIAVELEQK